MYAIPPYLCCFVLSTGKACVADSTYLEMKTYIRLIVYVLSRIGTFVTTAGSVFSILVLPPSFPLRGGEQRTGAQPKDVWADQGRVVWSFAGLAVRGCPDAADRFRKMKHRRVQKRISKAFPLTVLSFFFICLPHAACLLCWMPWLDHFCWVCSHVLSIISQMMAVSMASNWACCYLSPKRLFAGGLVGPLVTVYAMFGWFSYVCVCFQSLSPTWCLLLAALARWFCTGSTLFLFLFSSMFSFLGICICVLRIVSCWLPWTNHFAVGELGFACGLGRMMFAICEFSFSFIHPPNDVFCWMPRLCHFASCVFAFPFQICLHGCIFCFCHV